MVYRNHHYLLYRISIIYWAIFSSRCIQSIKLQTLLWFLQTFLYYQNLSLQVDCVLWALDMALPVAGEWVWHWMTLSSALRRRAVMMVCRQLWRRQGRRWRRSKEYDNASSSDDRLRNKFLRVTHEIRLITICCLCLLKHPCVIIKYLSSPRSVSLSPSPTSRVSSHSFNAQGLIQIFFFDARLLNIIRFEFQHRKSAPQWSMIDR